MITCRPSLIESQRDLGNPHHGYQGCRCGVLNTRTKHHGASARRRTSPFAIRSMRSCKRPVKHVIRAPTQSVAITFLPLNLTGRRFEISVTFHACSAHSVTTSFASSLHGVFACLFMVDTLAISLACSACFSFSLISSPSLIDRSKFDDDLIYANCMVWTICRLAQGSCLGGSLALVGWCAGSRWLQTVNGNPLPRGPLA